MKRPKGRKYRNLTWYRGVVYYQREIRGRKRWFPLGTTDWDDAAKARDLYEARRGIGRVPVLVLDTQTFAEAAAEYLAQGTGHLAATTLRGRKQLLKPEGRVTQYWGSKKLDTIDRPALLRFWHEHVEERDITTSTGRDYLDAISAVCGYAVDLGRLEANPVAGFRETLRRRSRSKRGRAEAEAGQHVRPVEPPEALNRLLGAAREKGGEIPHLWLLLQLDAGLRSGEAEGLRWSRVAWGADTDDTTRHLIIDRSRPRGGAAEPTKSGRSRRVGLSRRLRAALLEWYVAQGQPAGEEDVLPHFHRSNFLNRTWPKILERAKVAAVTPKDLRDSFASYLLSAGVQLGYVSRQLGHSDVATTARHYARWVGEEGYREPPRLRPGEVPADLLARLRASRPTSNPTSTAPKFVRRPEVALEKAERRH